MPNEAAMPDPDLKALHDQFLQQAKHLTAQYDDLCKYRANLTQKIEELERMMEAVNAAINSAGQHFPKVAPVREDHGYAKPNYPQGLGS